MTPGRKSARDGWGPEALTVAGWAAFAILGAGRWVNVQWDHALDLSNLESLLRGGRLLHDVRIQFGPGSLLLLEALCRIFGATTWTYAAASFAMALAFSVLLQRFARRFLPPAELWLAAAVSTVLVSWMPGPGNLAYPYRFAVTPALLTGALTLWLADRAARRGGWVAPAALGLAAAWTFLTKQEIGIAAALGSAAIIGLTRDVARASKIRLALLAGTAGAAAYFSVLLLLARGESLVALAQANLLWPWAPVPVAWKQLYWREQGLDRPLQHLAEAGDAALSLLLFGGVVWASVYGRFLTARRRRAAAAALVAAAAAWCWRWTEGSHFLPLTLALPACLGAAAIVGARARRDRDWRDRLGAYVAVAGVAIVLLQREGYRGLTDGFYSGVGYAFLPLAVAPLLTWVARGPKRSDPLRRGIAWAIVAAVVAYAGWRQLGRLSAQWRGEVRIVTPRGAVYASATASAPLRRLLGAIRATTRPGDPMLGIPDTVGLDFLLDRPNQSFFANLVPGTVRGPAGESELVARWEAQPPRVIILCRGCLGVYRSGEFGRGFADAAARWLNTRYRVEPERSSPAYEVLVPKPVPSESESNAGEARGAGSDGSAAPGRAP